MRETVARGIKKYMFHRVHGLTKDIFVTMDAPKVLSQYKDAKGELHDRSMAQTNKWKRSYRKLKKLWNATPKDRRNVLILNKLFSQVTI
jgi:hypothetical protein